jgi:hypothetical protein
MKRAAWRHFTNRRAKRIAIIPTNDLQPHIPGDYRCWCEPTFGRENDWLLIVHNSADGRELIERHGLQ